MTELFIRLTAIDRASKPIAALTGQIEKLNKAGAATRAAGAHMMAVGAGVAAIGAGVGYGLLKTVEAASIIQDQMARLQTVVPAGAAGVEELAAAHKAAVDTATHHAISEEQVIKQLYLGKSAGFSMATSIASMNTASALAIGLGGDMEETQRTLNLAYINFKDPAKSAEQNFKALGDVMAYATRQFDYKNIEELRSQMELATPTALAAGMGSPQGMKDMVAILADFTRHGLTGSIAGAAFEESLHGVLKMSKTLGIALVHNKEGGLDYMKSLEAIRTHFISLYGSMSAIPTGALAEIQKTFGIRGLRALLLDPAEMEGMRGQLDNVAGAAAGAQAIMERTPGAQWQILTQKFFALEELIGTALTPTVIKLMSYLGRAIDFVLRFATAHPQLVKFVALFAAMAAGLAVVVGGAIALGGALLVVASFGSTIGTVVASIAGIGLAVAGVVAAVATWFPKLFDSGLHLVKMLADGIMSGAHWAIESIEGVVKKIRDFLPFSPARTGALKDIHRIKIVEQVASAIRPDAAVRAMKRTMAAVAFSTALALPGAAAASGAGPSAAPITINIIVQGDVTERNMSALVDRIKHELENRSRTDF
ncbi:phage tail tape measure protein [Candidatus Binatus sp.]|uniref:phage tail tape measure protein n=1 Tax=Candidatus Binatus sp. TaxID=2811406 RepID=UPI003C6EFE98